MMKSSKALLQEAMSRLEMDEDPQEIKSIAHFLLEALYGISRTEIVSGRMIPWSPENALALENAIDRINRGEPVQYVVGWEMFCGRTFKVNPSVLIPRPETEELVRTVLAYLRSLSPHKKEVPFRIVDIGTGSGCIAITLSLELAGRADVFATDVSVAALEVAANNARALGAKVKLLHHDILKETLLLSPLDVIVSNPPYIREKEKSEMKPNVKEHEPPGALFVPDEDSLVFYREIARKATALLCAGGLLAMEINENLGDEVLSLFEKLGFRNVEIRQDVAGKNRIVLGINKG